MDLSKLTVRPIALGEDERYQQLLERHHYLGAIPKMGQTVRYVAQYGDSCVALLSFSASSLKCGARDRWIGWDARLQFGRLKLIANNSRFLILPDWHRPNLGSKVLALCERRLPRDWLERFGHPPLLLLETFVDPQRFHGTVYRAANWTCVGLTQGFRRTGAGYSAAPQTPKQVFVRALPESFQAIGEPRRAQGRRHPIRAVLGNRRRGLQVHVHVMSAVGHESRAAYTQKESPA